MGDDCERTGGIGDGRAADDGEGLGLGRRSFVKGATAASAVGLSGFAGQAAAAQSFVVEQNGEQIPVTPLSYGDQSIAEFYGLGDHGHNHANTPTGIERSDASRLFLYDGPNGLSLATIHDAPHDGSGGAATVSFDGLPVSGGTSPIFADSFDDGSVSDWTTTTEGDASVTVDDGRLQLRVFRCSRAVATRELGSHTGTITVSFSWRTKAEGWWEVPDWYLETADGEPIEYEVVSGSDVQSPPHSGSASGSVTVRADVDGPIQLRYEVLPSSYCGNGDHYDTYLWVDDLTVAPATGAWVVRDDDPGNDAWGDPTRVDWQWTGQNTDGGAFRGGLDGGLDVTVTPEFQEGIDEWEFLSGDASDPERISLDASSPVTVRTGSADGTSQYDAVKREKLALAERLTNVSQAVDEKARVEDALGALGSLVESGDVDEATAVEAVERMKLCEDVTEAAVAGWGPGDRVTPEDGDTLVGAPPYVDEHSTTSNIVEAAVNIIVEAALSALSVADLLKKLGPVKGILKRAKSKIDDFVAYVGRTILHDYDDLVWTLRDKVSGVVDGIYELIVGSGVKKGEKLARKQANDTFSVKELLAGVVASGVENDDVVPYEVPLTTVDDKLQEVDDQLAGGGQPSFSGSTDAAEVANDTATSDVYETVEETQSNFDALFEYLNIVGWLSVIGAALLATGFFAPIGAAYNLGIFIVNLILNIGGIVGGAIVLFDLLGTHNDALDAIVAGQTEV